MYREIKLDNALTNKAAQFLPLLDRQQIKYYTHDEYDFYLVQEDDNVVFECRFIDTGKTVMACHSKELNSLIDEFDKPN